MLSSVFTQVKEVNCKALEEVQKVYLAKVKERAEFAKKFLSDKYKLDRTVEIQFDPDKREYAPSLEKLNEFHKKYIHFQVGNHVATDMKEDEARKEVIKGYERLVKKVGEIKNSELLAEYYLDSFARALDPHSSFFSKDVLEDFEINMRLSLEGIGATLSSQNGFTIVELLVPGGAAARSGLIEQQDKIVAVGQGEAGPMENVVEMDLRDVVKKIRGPAGTKVRLSLLRKKGEEKEKFTITLVRDKIKLEDEAAKIFYLDREVEGKKKTIAVLDLPSFYSDSRKEGRQSSTDMKKLLAEAAAKKVDGMVLDFADNGGGSLDDAVKIAGLFFKTGNVVKQSGKDGRTESTLKDVDALVDYAGPLVVLTSRASASASEIVAGTLQDYHRAVIVGADHTFGKGSVQSVMPIPRGMGAIKVTVGMFFVPGGSSTQHKGVEADVVLPGPLSTDEMGEKSLDYSLPPVKVAPFLSPEANVALSPTAAGSEVKSDAKSYWQPIKPEWIPVLKEKSKARVEKNTEFKKIVEDLAKSDEKGRLIKLSEVLKDGGEKEKKRKALKTASKEEKEKEYLKRPEILEATAVLTDLLALESKGETVK